VKWIHALLIAALFVVSSPGPLAAQAGWEPREFTVDVAPTLKFPGLSAGERVLMFDRPVLIPGARLSAGPYIFRMLTPQLLQVSDASRVQVYATFFVIPIYRNGSRDSGLEQIKFQETGDDESLRIVAWYPSGGNGYEFPYKKEKRRPERQIER
jgi:hypothetical protein